MDIEIEAKKLVGKLLQERLSESNITLTLLGMFSRLSYPYDNVKTGREIGINSEYVIKLLLDKKVLTLHEIIPFENNYPVKPTKFIVSYDKNFAENFLFIIKHGEFTWDKRDGAWRFKDKSYSFRPGTGQYKIIDMFMESPNKPFTEEEIVNTFSDNTDIDIKRKANDIIRDIKKPLKILKEHFVSGDGYTFKPEI
jgi:hypothetical protein